MTSVVSMIVATHNRPAMLRVTLYSLLATVAMAEEDAQILVVDDASDTMAARDIAKTVGVDYIRNPVNLGVAGTLTAGFDATDSEYSVFWGDDDVALPRFLPLHLARIREGHDVVYSSYYLADHDLRLGREMRLPLVTHRDLLRGQCNATDQSLIRRSAIEAVGGWRPLYERAMLMDLWLRMTHAGKDIATIREATWLYRRHEAQLSHVRPSPHDQALRDAAVAEYQERV